MPMALPVYSVDTEQDAEDLQIVLCRLAYDGQYIMADFAERADEDPMASLEWATERMRVTERQMALKRKQE